MSTDKAVGVVVVAVVGLLCAPSPGLFQASDDASKSGHVDCFRGWTGPNSGGSCSWDNTLCDWEQVKEDDLEWELTNTGQVKLDPDAYSGPEEGRLLSPVLCEEAGRHLCVQVRFRFSRGGDTEWFLRRCQGMTCVNLLHYKYDGDTDWFVDSTEFYATGDSFRIAIIGKKFYNGWGDESNVYIDYIRYNNASCGEKATGVTSLTTTMFPPSISTEEPSTISSPVSSTATEVMATTSFGGNENGNASSALKNDEQGGVGGIPVVIIIGASAALLVIIIIVVVVSVVLVKRRNRRTQEKDTELAVHYERHDRVTTVSNELYNCAPSIMLGDSPQQPTPVTSNNGDVTSRLPMTPSDYDNVNSQFAGSGPRQKSSSAADTHEDAVYDVADEQQDIYENTERGDDDGGKDVYENTALRHAEPATATQEAEYSHLTDPQNRPDRRCDNYDRMK